MSNKINYGVIGVGHLGKFHVQQLLNINNINLVGVFDTNLHAIQKLDVISENHVFNNLDDLLKRCDAVSIVTPTETHFDVASNALNAGCHILIEKPISSDVGDAEKIIQLAKNKKLKVQVGHIERFSPVFRKYLKNNPKPIFIESHRLAPFNVRGTDVAVVLDLMIHDLDLLLNVVDSKIVDIRASGASVISDLIDLASARITFANGVVANVTASRISNQQMRKMRLFEKKSYTTLDFGEQTLKNFTINNKLQIKENIIKIKNENALLLELQSFTDSIMSDSSVVVSGEDGLKALKIAYKIQHIIEKQKL